TSPVLIRAFFLPAPATTEIYTLSLHDALPISDISARRMEMGVTLSLAALGGRAGLHRQRLNDLAVTVINQGRPTWTTVINQQLRSEEHTSELQSRENLVCRLLLEKKKRKNYTI